MCRQNSRQLRTLQRGECRDACWLRDQLNDATGCEQLVQRGLGDAQEIAEAESGETFDTVGGEVDLDEVVGVGTADPEQASSLLDGQRQR